MGVSSSKSDQFACPICAHNQHHELPDLTAAGLAKLLGLTERQVKERVARKIFICHWRGGTIEHPRSMRFTPEDITYNRNTGATHPAAHATLDSSTAQIQKGIARLRRSGRAMPS